MLKQLGQSFLSLSSLKNKFQGRQLALCALLFVALYVVGWVSVISLTNHVSDLVLQKLDEERALFAEQRPFDANLTSVPDQSQNSADQINDDLSQLNDTTITLSINESMSANTTDIRDNNNSLNHNTEAIIPATIIPDRMIKPPDFITKSKQETIYRRDPMKEEFQQLDLNQKMRDSMTFVKKYVRPSLNYTSDQILRKIVDNYRLSAKSTADVRIGIITAIGNGFENPLSKYSMNRNGYAQLSKLLFVRSMNQEYRNRYLRSISVDPKSNSINNNNGNNNKQHKYVFKVQFDAIFDTFDYITWSHSNQTYEYHLSQSQIEQCADIKESIFFDEMHQCSTPKHTSKWFNKHSSLISARLDPRKHLNCTSFNITTDIRWNKVLTLQYWSSVYDILVWTDDDTWFGTRQDLLIHAFDQALYGTYLKLPLFGIDLNQRLKIQIPNLNPLIKKYFLWLPYDYRDKLSVFNWGFILDVRNDKLGRKLLNQWWLSRMNKAATYADQGPFWLTLLNMFVDEGWLGDDERGQSTKKCIKMCDLCFGNSCFDHCLNEIHGIYRGLNQGSGEFIWDWLPIVFMGHRMTSTQLNWESWPRAHHIHHLFQAQVAHHGWFHYRHKIPDKLKLQQNFSLLWADLLE